MVPFYAIMKAMTRTNYAEISPDYKKLMKKDIFSFFKFLILISFSIAQNDTHVIKNLLGVSLE